MRRTTAAVSQSSSTPTPPPADGRSARGPARVGDIVVAAPPPRVVSSVGHRYPPSAVRSPVVTDCTRGVDTRVLFVVVAGCRRRRDRCRVVFVSRRRRVC